MFHETKRNKKSIYFGVGSCRKKIQLDILTKELKKILLFWREKLDMTFQKIKELTEKSFFLAKNKRTEKILLFGVGSWRLGGAGLMVGCVKRQW